MGGGDNVEEKANLKKLKPEEKKALDHLAPNDRIIWPPGVKSAKDQGGRMVFSSAPRTKKIAGDFQGNSHRGRMGGGMVFPSAPRMLKPSGPYQEASHSGTRARWSGSRGNIPSTRKGIFQEEGRTIRPSY